MTNGGQGRGPWAAYAAALWAFIFAIFHLIWAAGWYVGLDQEWARTAFAKKPFLIYDLVIAGIGVFAVAVALALARPWGRRLPRRLVGLFAWGGTGLLALGVVISIVKTLYPIATGQFVVEPRSLAGNLAFCLGAALFGLASWRFWRSSSV